MARERDVRDPIVRTYLNFGKRRDGKTVVHARIYSPSYQLDKRGTGTSIKTAVSRARSGVPRTR